MCCHGNMICCNSPKGQLLIFFIIPPISDMGNKNLKSVFWNFLYKHIIFVFEMCENRSRIIFFVQSRHVIPHFLALVALSPMLSSVFKSDHRKYQKNAFKRNCVISSISVQIHPNTACHTSIFSPCHADSKSVVRFRIGAREVRKNAVKRDRGNVFVHCSVPSDPERTERNQCNSYLRRDPLNGWELKFSKKLKRLLRKL